MLSRSTQLRGALISALVCALWAALAVRSPSLTYHFAPLIAAAVWPISLRSSGRRTSSEARIAGLGGAALATSVGVALAVASLLEGPTLWGEGGALVEVVLFAVLAGWFGARVASRERPGLLGGLVDQTASD